VEAARRFLVLAGDRASNLDLDRARSWYRQALDLSPPGHPQRPQLLARAGRVAFQAGELAEAAAAYEEAIAGLRDLGDVRGLGAAMGRLATVRWNQGDTRGATAVLTEAIELLEREPPSPELCSAYEGMAGDRVMSGHAKEALDWADKALTLADDLGGLPEVRPRVLDARGMARCDLGDFGGMDDLRAALALGLELGAGYDTAVIYNNLAEPVWLVDGSTAALDLCQEGIDFAERRGLGQHLADLVRLTAEAAPALARDLVEHAQPTATRYRLAALTARAVLAETAGHAEQAAGLFAEAADGWLAYGQLLEHGLALLGAGRCRGRLGHPDSRSALRDAHALFTRLGAHPLAAEAGGLLRAAPGT